MIPLKTFKLRTLETFPQAEDEFLEFAHLTLKDNEVNFQYKKKYMKLVTSKQPAPGYQKIKVGNGLEYRKSVPAHRLETISTVEELQEWWKLNRKEANQFVEKNKPAEKTKQVEDKPTKKNKPTKDEPEKD